MSDLSAPFPWFGGKSRAAPAIWDALGDPPNYVEPFAGSMAALLGRPGGAGKIVDAKVAGWWVWGACAWIGSGWCSGTGPWWSDGKRLHKSGNAGRGVNRQLPHLGDAGRGVNRGSAAVLTWLEALSKRLRGCRIACGDWRRVTTPVVTWRHGVTGVLLDPPYPTGWDPSAAYAGQVGTVERLWMDVTTWAAEAGERDDMRVVMCGYEGDWAPPDGWTSRPWKARKGYQLTQKQEVLWCSPACLGARQPGLFGASR